jgi:trimeric autotransporter adhesin
MGNTIFPSDRGHVKHLMAIVALMMLPASAVQGQGSIRTVAGGVPDNLPSTSVGFIPTGVFKDAAGNLYVSSFAGTYSSNIYKISSSGNLTTIAGNGTAGFGGDGEPATNAVLNMPGGVFVDAAGNVFISDIQNARIREIVAATGDIQTIAGGGTITGDGEPATEAQLDFATGGSVYSRFTAMLVVDSAGNVFFAEAGENRIREIVAATGDIQTAAGGGTVFGDGGPATSAQLSSPTGVAVDAAGDIFIADTGNNRIREVSAATGDIQTVAGNGTSGFGGDGGLATSAELNNPAGVSVDSAGNIFIADSGNTRIREVRAGTRNIQTVAGDGTFGFSGDGGPSTSAELGTPISVFLDAAGNILIPDFSEDRVREVDASTGIIETVAGNGTLSFGGDGSAATDAELALPYTLALDPAGDIFIADSQNNCIREVVAATGDIRSVVGNGLPGFSGDGGPAASAELSGPNGVSLDFAGDIFISDAGNSRIREVFAATGNINTVAGNGTAGFTGDGGPATSAELNLASAMSAVSVDPVGNIFIVDFPDNRIREVSAATGDIQTVAGGGTFFGDGGLATSAELAAPRGVFVDASDNIFIADTSNSRIREVAAATGIINTVAGNGTRGFAGDGGPATGAELDFPSDVFLDAQGNMFISDSLNNRVREVLASTGNIQTIAGNGTAGFSGDGGPPLNAEFNQAAGIFGDGRGNILVADWQNNRIREFPAAVPPSCTLGANPTKLEAGQSVTATLTCSATVNDSLSVTVNWGDGSSLSTATNVASGGAVTFSFTHTYQNASSPTYSASASLTDTTLNFTGTVSPSSVAITAFAAPVVTPAQQNISGTPGESVSMTLSFAGGSAESGLVFSTVTCTVSPAATCTAPSSLNLDSNGNGTLMVTVTTPANAASPLIVIKPNLGVPLATSLILFLGLLFYRAGSHTLQSWGRSRWAFSAVVAMLPILISIEACGSGGSAPNTRKSVVYTVTVQAQSTPTPQLPAITTSGTFTVTVQYP